MLKSVIRAVFGTRHQRELKRLQPLVEQINRHVESLQGVSEEELKGQTERFREQIREATADIQAELDALRAEKRASESSAEREELAVRMGEVEKRLKSATEAVLDEILPEAFATVKEACRRPDGTAASLKVILETGELVTYDNVRRASWLSILAGGDFIKTSTGKVQPAATLPVTLLMLEVVRDWHLLTGQRIGVKPAGGIRASKDAIRYLVTVAETVGEEWLVPHLFRFGASSLLNDVLLQRQKMTTGHYSGPDYVTID